MAIGCSRVLAAVGRFSPALCLPGLGPAWGGASAPLAGAAVPASGVVQVVVGLILVLAVVAAAAWLLKRLSLVPGSGSGPVRIVGGASVGQRERIVVVEVAGTWLVVGVAAGQVRALHAMPKGEASEPPPAAQPSALSRRSEAPVQLRSAGDSNSGLHCATPQARRFGLSFQSLLRRITEGRRHAG